MLRIMWLARSGIPLLPSDAKRRNSGSPEDAARTFPPSAFRVASGRDWKNGYASEVPLTAAENCRSIESFSSGKEGVPQEGGHEERGNPLAEGILGHSRKEAGRTNPSRIPSGAPVVPVDELPRGPLEFRSDVDDCGERDSGQTDSPTPGPLPRGGFRAATGARESKRERSRARGPAQLSTVTSPAATVTPRNAGSAPRAYDRMATPIASSATARHAEGGNPERGPGFGGDGARAPRSPSSSAARPRRPASRRSRPAPLADLREQFPYRTPISRARARTAPTFRSSPPKKFEKFLFPEIFRLVRVTRIRAKVGESESRPAPSAMYRFRSLKNCPLLRGGRVVRPTRQSTATMVGW